MDPGFRRDDGKGAGLAMMMLAGRPRHHDVDAVDRGTAQ